MANAAEGATAPIVFNFDSHTVRTITRDGEVWFVATDVAAALNYRDADKAVRLLDDDETGTHIMGIRSESGVVQDRELLIINESGLYSLILRSRKPEAKRFKKWVTSEVLPAIRKTGAYIIQDSRPGLTAAQQDELRGKLQGLTGIAGLGNQSGQWVCNHLRVVFQVKQVEDIPAEHFALVLQIVDSKRDAVFQFASALRETRKWFEKEVLAGGTPWTPDVKAKLTRKLQRQVILPPRVDWLALAREAQIPDSGSAKTDSQSTG